MPTSNHDTIDSPSIAAAAPGWRQRLRVPLLIAVPALVLLGGATAYLADANAVSTDDAFVEAAKTTLNARVAGQVVEIAVRNNQVVHKGQLLFRIDPQPYQIAVEQAEARLAAARLQVRGLKATYRQQLADLQATRDSADYEGKEFDRKKNLLAADVTSRSAYDMSETALKVAQRHITASENQVANSLAALDGNPAIALDRHPTVRDAQAQLDQARLNLSYTRIVAPDDGVVAKVDDLQPGDFVSAGSAVFSLLSSRHIWIEANFRETGLTHMRAGQPATIAVDAYPGHVFRAHVTSMSPGTGSQFSVLPPENATGNWIKVVQRLPVRIELDAADPARPLYSGISVTARVDTRRHAPGAGQ